MHQVWVVVVWQHHKRPTSRMVNPSIPNVPEDYDLLTKMLLGDISRTAISYTMLALVCCFGGPLVNKLGVKWSLVIGAATFPIRGASYYVNSKYGNQWVSVAFLHHANYMATCLTVRGKL